MKQEEKDLLLKDLCGRLPYGVMVLEDIDKEFDGGCVSELTSITEFKGEKRFLTKGSLVLMPIEEIRPYLRSMSSMTEEERLKLKEWIFVASDTKGKIYFAGFRNISAEDTIEAIDYLNSHYFDFRGLIPMGLALEAPEGMYKVK